MSDARFLKELRDWARALYKQPEPVDSDLLSHILSDLADAIDPEVTNE